MSSPLWKACHPLDNSYESYDLNIDGISCSVTSWERLGDGTLVHRPANDPMDPAKTVFVPLVNGRGGSGQTALISFPTAEAAKLHCENVLLKAARAVIAALGNPVKV